MSAFFNRSYLTTSTILVARIFSFYLLQVAHAKSKLDAKERSCLSVAFKNAIGSRRAAWRVLRSIQPRPEADGEKQAAKLQMIEDYKRRIQSEVETICQDAVNVVRHVLSRTEDDLSAECKVFYHKMIGDYYRYMSEVEAKPSVVESASKGYQDAMACASELDETNPVRLGLVLNYSVFRYEVLCEPKKARDIASNAFRDALSKLDDLGPEEYNNATAIMQLIKDNLKLWRRDSEVVNAKTTGGEETGESEKDGAALAEEDRSTSGS